jgi:uncharacterized membrane protein YidH (DUF202 family)
MIFLQAAIAGGIVLLIGIPILTGIFMNVYWRSVGKEENIKNKKPYYSDPFPFIVTIIVSILILLCLFYLLIIILDKVFPGYGYSN